MMVIPISGTRSRHAFAIPGYLMVRSAVLRTAHDISPRIFVGTDGFESLTALCQIWTALRFANISEPTLVKNRN